ncbi:hypothetical protein SKAU_G00160320 [Synaphobranchus kaupii]|uniref:Uncharacterized protein n=1 Tax=Synaphobranchus kaupii TaxID=118154 RepID=A0A9Q1IZT6_SYNKA|nr:hypothetical protein SKAU_G00160320 [Synaphobranchus kaupii]
MQKRCRLPEPSRETHCVAAGTREGTERQREREYSCPALPLAGHPQPCILRSPAVGETILLDHVISCLLLPEGVPGQETWPKAKGNRPQTLQRSESGARVRAAASADAFLSEITIESETVAFLGKSPKRAQQNMTPRTP